MAANPLLQPAQAAALISPVRKLFSPDLLVHVGAGAGTGLLAAWRDWGLENVLVIDAEPHKLNWVSAPSEEQRWRSCGAVLASRVGSAIWREASYAEESGLLSVDQLLSLPTDVQVCGEYERATTSLDDLVDCDQPGLRQVWLLIDCFPSVLILQGAQRLLRKATSVVWLRVIIADHQPEAMGLKEAEKFLAEFGFVLLYVIENDHPTLGYALFVRNRATELWSDVANLHEELREQKTRLNAMESMLKSCRAAEKRASELEDRLQRSESLRRSLEEQVGRAEEQLRFIENILLKDGKP